MLLRFIAQNLQIPDSSSREGRFSESYMESLTREEPYLFPSDEDSSADRKDPDMPPLSIPRKASSTDWKSVDVARKRLGVGAKNLGKGVKKKNNRLIAIALFATPVVFFAAGAGVYLFDPSMLSPVERIVGVGAGSPAVDMPPRPALPAMGHHSAVSVPPVEKHAVVAYEQAKAQIAAGMTAVAKSSVIPPVADSGAQTSPDSHPLATSIAVPKNSSPVQKTLPEKSVSSVNLPPLNAPTPNIATAAQAAKAQSSTVKPSPEKAVEDKTHIAPQMASKKPSTVSAETAKKPVTNTAQEIAQPAYHPPVWHPVWRPAPPHAVDRKGPVSKQAQESVDSVF